MSKWLDRDVRLPVGWVLGMVCLLVHDAVSDFGGGGWSAFRGLLLIVSGALLIRATWLRWVRT